MQMYTATRLTTAIHRRLLSRFFLREGGRLYTGYGESTRNQVDEELLCGCATCKSLFIYLFYIGRPRKAGPPPERKLEGSIDVIGGEGSRGMRIVVL